MRERYTQNDVPQTSYTQNDVQSIHTNECMIKFVKREQIKGEGIYVFLSKIARSERRQRPISRGYRKVTPNNTADIFIVGEGRPRDPIAPCNHPGKVLPGINGLHMRTNKQEEVTHERKS